MACGVFKLAALGVKALAVGVVKNQFIFFGVLQKVLGDNVGFQLLVLRPALFAVTALSFLLFRNDSWNDINLFIMHFLFYYKITKKKSSDYLVAIQIPVAFREKLCYYLKVISIIQRMVYIVHFLIGFLLIVLLLIVLIASKIQKTAGDIQTKINEKKLISALEVLASENCLNFSSRFLVPSENVVICIDTIAHKIVLANNEIEPTVFECSKITKYIIRNKVEEHLTLWKQYLDTDVSDRDEWKAAKTAFENSAGRYLAAVTIFIDGEKIFLPILYSDGSFTEESCRNAEAILSEIDKLLGEFVAVRESE